MIATWWILLAVGVLGSALYSGIETGVYRINRVRLQILHHQKQRSARVLHDLILRPTSLLGTLLIGNNVANYLGTASLAMILDHWGIADWEAILINVLVVSPLLLVFGETLPKDMFAAYTDLLTYRFAGFLNVSRRLFFFTGLLPLTEAFSKLMARALGVPISEASFHPRRQVELLVQEGVGQGLLSDEQSAIVERVLDLATRSVVDEMVPWARVTKVRVSGSPSVIWKLADHTSFSRFPVTDKSGAVLGVISVIEALRHTPDRCPPLEQLMTPPLLLDAATPLRTALTTLQTKRTPFAIVTRKAKPIGIVTIKDLVEPITGELMSW